MTNGGDKTHGTKDSEKGTPSGSVGKPKDEKEGKKK